MALPSLSEITSALLAPSSWIGGSTITYSIPRAGSVWSDYGPGEEPTDPAYGVLNAIQAQRFAAAIEAWNKVMAVNFVQTDDVAAAGQIRVAFTDVSGDDGEDTWGYAYYPPLFGGAGSAYMSDIWISSEHADSDFSAGRYDFSAMIHEIGHAIGLKHSFEDGATLSADYDTTRYTVMSYTGAEDLFFWRAEATATGVRIVPQSVYPETPMVFDIAAVQQRYGADPTTAAGDTTYSWDENRPFFQSIYDAGGVDTFDLSGNQRGASIDLTPGAYSSIAEFPAAEQIAKLLVQFPWAGDFFQENIAQPDTYTFSDNLGIAFNTVIENVVGSVDADTVLGNAAQNQFWGGGGTDFLRGMDGNDQLWGGAAFDDVHGNAGDDTVHGDDGADWVVGGKDQDLLFGDAGGDIVYGNLGNDTCEGGAGDDLVRGGKDNDTLSGGEGNDWLSGDRGDDTIAGGAGADIFHSSGDAGLDRVLDFNSAQGDRILLDPGTTYALRHEGADTIIDLAWSGQPTAGQIVLAGVTAATLGDWLIA